MDGRAQRVAVAAAEAGQCRLTRSMLRRCSTRMMGPLIRRCSSVSSQGSSATKDPLLICLDLDACLVHCEVADPTAKGCWSVRGSPSHQHKQSSPCHEFVMSGMETPVQVQSKIRLGNNNQTVSFQPLTASRHWPRSMHYQRQKFDYQRQNLFSCVTRLSLQP